MTDHAPDALDQLRTLTTQLLASIDAWRREVVDANDFRRRLVRAHLVAVLDELEQFAPARGRSERAGGTHGEEPDPPDAR